jgi:hypothetical protein
MQLDGLRDPQVVALKAQRMGMVLPSSPAVLDLRSGTVLGSPAPATRLDPLRLLAPPPAKPAGLDPQTHVTVVPPTTTTTTTTTTKHHRRAQHPSTPSGTH